MELVSSAGGLFDVFTCSVNRDEGSEQDLDKNRVVLPVRGVAALTAEEIENAYARGQKSADYQKPEKNIVAVHCGLKSKLAGQTAISGYKTADSRTENQRKDI